MAVELAWEQKGKRLAVEDVQTMSAIRNLPARSVVVISDVHECERHLESIDRTVYFIGLDCEWVSKGKENRPVALIQVATPHRDCFLIRLNKLQSVPESLQRILSNKRVMKFGVGIMEDRKRLFQRTLVLPVSCVDLRNVAALCGLSGSLSLAALTKELTGTDLNKDSGVRRGDWEADTLSPAQITYAAMDALVAVDIVSALVNRKLVLDRGEHTDSTTTVQGHFVHWDTPDFNDVLHSMCEPFLDIGHSFKASSVNQDAPLRATSAPVVHQSQLPPQRTKSYSLRKTPLYDNCQLLAPDGQLLSTIDRRKMNWYLQRGLAEVVTENPPTIMTNFEPAGRPGDEREYYLTEKENRCVVCGRMDSYIRKNVVPHEYRRFFPAQHKVHLSHDVLLLCVNCHQLSSQHDTRRRQSLAAECNAPLHLSMPKQNEDSWLAQVKSHSKALLRRKDIPEERRRVLLSTLQQHFGAEEVTKEMMEEGAQMDIKSKLSIERSMSHGQKVVQIVLQQQRLLAFQQEWRQHFVDTMHPKYLPDLWSVSHNPAAAPDLEPSMASWGVTVGFFISTAVQLFCLYTVLRGTRE